MKGSFGTLLYVGDWDDNDSKVNFFTARIFDDVRPTTERPT